MALLLGFLTFCGVTIVDLTVLDLLQRETGTGFGMCGLSGSDFWLLVMLVMFLGGPLLGIAMGVKVARRLIIPYTPPSIK
ncbi:MAG TPA: hypothetical protein VKJ45_00800 [Blastocatellia bacterium]|nr:hypothetical protein [Blastocatellia bacterium]